MLTALKTMFRKMTKERSQFLIQVQEGIIKGRFYVNNGLSHYGNKKLGTKTQYKNIFIKIKKFNNNPDSTLDILLNTSLMSDEPESATLWLGEQKVDVTYLITSDVRKMVKLAHQQESQFKSGKMIMISKKDYNR